MMLLHRSVLRRFRNLFCALFLIAIVVFASLFLDLTRSRHPISPIVDFIVDDNANFSSEPKTILMWTKHYWVDWIDLKFEGNSLCPNRCRIINNRKTLSAASAVVFHANADDLALSDIPRRRWANQAYVFYTNESPPKIPKPQLTELSAFPRHFFNVTMTYRKDSDVVVQYDRLIGRNETFTGVPFSVYTWDEVIAAIDRKTKMALWFVGNCYSGSGRETVVRKLEQYISIDKFGFCTGNVCDRACEDRILGDYRFYLAFENNICIDYVTEKFWRMKRLIVPIVLRFSIAEQVAPRHSFIAVDQFDSVRDLADYLQYLVRNRTAYEGYFEWTRHFQRSSIPSNAAFCTLCDRLRQPIIVRKSYRNVVEWYSPEGICHYLAWNGFFEVFYTWKRLTYAIFAFICLTLVLILILVRRCRNRCANTPV